MNDSLVMALRQRYAEALVDRGAVQRELEEVQLTAAQRRRWAYVRLEGWLALPPASAHAFAVAACLGRVLRQDGTFGRLGSWTDARCVVLGRTQRDRVRRLLGHGDDGRRWRRLVAAWTAAHMAHRCESGKLALFLEPAPTCPACRAPLPRAPVGRSSGDRGTGHPATGEPVIRRPVGDARAGAKPQVTAGARVQPAGNVT